MFRRTMIFAIATTILGSAMSASADEHPPDNYRFSGRPHMDSLTAWNYLSTPQDGLLSIQTDTSGDFAMRMAGWFGGDYIDSYFQRDQTGDGGRGDWNLFRFDIWSYPAAGGMDHFAGRSQFYTMEASDGRTLAHWQQEVNGVSHAINAEVDRDGNATILALTKGKSQRDPCAVMSDWGELRCPMPRSGPVSIPSSMKSLIRQTGWISSAWKTVSNKVVEGATYVVKKLGDPKIQLYAVTVGAALGLVGCMATGAAMPGFAAVCISTVVTGYSVAVASIAGQPRYTDVERRSDELRRRGMISCEEPECYRLTKFCNVHDDVNPCR